ncbi:AEC family transporter [Phormidesmis sp. 146-33]
MYHPSLMPHLTIQLFDLYVPLVGWALLGWLLGRYLPQSAAKYLGQFLFWVGIPFSILGFLRGADLSGQIWIAPVVAWVAIFTGAGLAWLRIRSQNWSRPTQGSFLLSSMVGNTGYLGFPVTLALVGEKFFAWALFYDLLGSTLGTWGLGVIVASQFGLGQESRLQLTLTILKNPALWSFGFGLATRNLPLPEVLESSLHHLAWSAIALALVLIGMRLSQLPSLTHLNRAAWSLTIKMLIVPLVLGVGILPLFQITGSVQQAIVLQMAMPPAFSTLVLAEIYELDKNLTVTALATGSIALLITLPLWLLILDQ